MVHLFGAGSPDRHGDRVAVHQKSLRTNGLAGIWNRCIERARGEWVHILHQDDIVLPGFYIVFVMASHIIRMSEWPFVDS